MQDDRLDAPAPSAVPERVLHSDPHDFAGLYIRHRSSFTLHARRYLRDQRDADEVVQEAFLRLFLALPELETELQALAYCRRTITNLCIDRYRAQARRPHLVDLDSVPVEELADDVQDDPVVRAEDAAVVREALSLLSPLHRAALVKREIEEKTIPVIAAELAIPEENVKHLLFRARRALRRVLAGTSVAPEALARAVQKGGTGLGALVLLLAAGLSTGPDLRAIPVVGADLPDLPAITDVVRDVISAITGPSEAGDGGDADAGTTGGPEESAPLLAPASPSPSPSASTSPSAVPTLAPTAAPEPATGTATITSPSPSPTGSATPSPSPSGLPVVVGPSGTPQPSTDPSAAPSAAPAPSGQASPSPTATAEASTSPTSSPQAEPSSRPHQSDEEFALRDGTGPLQP